MYIEQTKDSYKVYLTKEEIAQLDEEDKKLLKPCKKEIPIMHAEWQFKIPEGIENLSNEERFKVLADMVTETKREPIELKSLDELKESIEAKYDKNNIAIL